MARLTKDLASFGYFDPGQPRPNPFQPWPAWAKLAWVGRTQARPSWPRGRGFPGFFIPWPAWSKPGHRPGSPRLSGQALTLVYPGLTRLLMQGNFVAKRRIELFDGCSTLAIVPDSSWTEILTLLRRKLSNLWDCFIRAWKIMPFIYSAMTVHKLMLKCTSLPN